MYPNYPSPSKHYSSELIKSILIILFISIACSIKAQQKVIPLYTGPAPGSETWNWEEKQSTSKNTPVIFPIVYNVSSPTLTVFSPDSATANGTAIIIFPGGAFHVLNIEHEGSHVAKKLNEKGFTVFMLKYRVVHSLTDNPWLEMISSRKDTIEFQKKIAPVKTKALEAIKTVAKEKGYTYVIDDATSILFVMPPGDDLLPFVKTKLGIKDPAPASPKPAGN